MISTTRHSALLTAVVLIACAGRPPEDPVPAVLVATDESTRDTIAEVITQALGREVTLAPDALTRSSRLLIEPVRARDGAGRLLQGLETRAPESFQLSKRGDTCVLTHERTGRAYVLHTVRCEAEAPR
jgi:hypothetical protein